MFLILINSCIYTYLLLPHFILYEEILSLILWLNPPAHPLAWTVTSRHPLYHLFQYQSSCQFSAYLPTVQFFMRFWGPFLLTQEWKKYVLKVYDNINLKHLEREAYKSIKQTAQLRIPFHSPGFVNQMVFLGSLQKSKSIRFLSQYISICGNIFERKHRNWELDFYKWYVIHYLQRPFCSTSYH